MVEKYFTNCRGVNFFPEYPTVWAQYNNMPNPAAGWYGANGPLSIWRFYNSNDVRQQIRDLRHIGINTVRIYLHFDAWAADPTQFKANLRDFARICDRYHIYIMWTLFDNVGLETYQPLTFSSTLNPLINPDRITDLNPSNATNIYTNAPSLAHIVNDASVANFFDNLGGNEYIDDVVSSVKGYQSTLLYDIYNEPPASGSTQQGFAAIGGDPDNYRSSGINTFLASALARVKTNDPNPRHKTTIGFATVNTYSSVPEIYQYSVSDPNLDVISFHQYILLKECRLQNYNQVSAAAEYWNKPIILTECVNPDFYIKHNEIFDWFKRETGVGIITFSPTIGHPFSTEPFKLFGVGMLYSDGEYKDRTEASAIIDYGFSSGHFLRHQLPSVNFLRTKDASSFQRDTNLIAAVSAGNGGTAVGTYISNFSGTRVAFNASDMSHTNFVSYFIDGSGVFPLFVPVSQVYGVPENTQIGKTNPYILEVGYDEAIASATNYLNRNYLSGFNYPITVDTTEYNNVQKEFRFWQNLTTILLRDLGIMSDLPYLRGTIHERNILSDSLENDLSSINAIISGSNKPLDIGLEISSQSMASSFDVSFTAAYAIINQALSAIGEI